MNSPSKILAISLLLRLLTAPNADAMPPTGRILVGKVQQTNFATHSAVLVPEDGSAPCPFTWVSRTVVFAGPIKACPAAIRDGMTIRIIRHVPIFGPPFATRINLPASAMQFTRKRAVCCAK